MKPVFAIKPNSWGESDILSKLILAVIATALLIPGLLPAQDPVVTDEERHLAINDPDRFAWLLFERINRDVPNDPQRRVIWETWALANTVFADPNQAPVWQGPAAPARATDRMEFLPQQEIIRRQEAARRGVVLPQFHPILAQNQANETRLNRAAFDYVVANELYNVEGQEAFFHRGENLDFPLDAQEIKAQWRRITADQRNRYHTATSNNSDGTQQLWGLTSLHITTKDLPNWFWATFEHQDNPGREAVVPSVDSSGLPDSLKGTKWENYILRGTQVDFVDPVGRSTILASSQIERGFQRSSSCITCHARAAIGERPRNGTEVNRLSVFEGEHGSIGIPNPSWFLDTERVPQSREYVQQDFVWSLRRAQRKSVPGGAGATSQAQPQAPAPGVATPAAALPLMQKPSQVAKRKPVIQLPENEVKRLLESRGIETLELIEANKLIRGPEARAQFDVSGAGLTVAVLDTGINASHVDFANKIVTQINFTQDNGGDPNDADDGDGHGSNVSGIVVANGDHVGIAPGATVVPIKVLDNSGGGSFQGITQGLKWVVDNHAQHGITAVNMSLGDSGNYTSDNFGPDSLEDHIVTLRSRNIPVVVSAGNEFFVHNSAQGMGYPGIFRETVSVGAVYDSFLPNSMLYQSGAFAQFGQSDQITPFSQRLHPSANAALRTDIFAPGAPIESSGIGGPHGITIQDGTSQAAPVTTGVILLMQEFHKRKTGALPTVDQIESWLRSSAVTIADDHGPIDNVVNTNLEFLRVDALSALTAIQETLTD